MMFIQCLSPMKYGRLLSRMTSSCKRKHAESLNAISSFLQASVLTCQEAPNNSLREISQNTWPHRAILLAASGNSLGRIFLTLFLSLFVLSLSGREIGSWQIYPAYTYCSNNISVGKRVYAITENNLFAYDTEDKSITLFDWQHQLNDVSIVNAKYSQEAGRIIIVYDNGNIDLLSATDDNDVVNLSQLKDNTSFVKTINYIQISGPRAYLCTTFGIIVINMKDCFIENTFQLNMNVYACAVSETKLLASTDGGIYAGDLSNNLMNKDNWQLISESFKPKFLEYFDGRFWALDSRNLYQINPDQSNFSRILSSSNLSSAPKYFNVCKDRLLFSTNSKTYVFTSYNSHEEYNTSFDWAALTYDGKLYWAADRYSGLQGYNLADGQFTVAVSSIQPNSPLHDYSLHLNLIGDRLLVAGGNWAYATVNRPGTVMILEPDGTWNNFDYNSVKEMFPNENFINVTDVVQDPNDENHHFAGTSFNGIFEFRNGKCVGHLGLDNSPLKSVLPNSTNPHWFVTANGLTYDKEGNMWVLNCTESLSDSIIRIRKTNGTWISLPTKSELPDISTADKIYFDSKNRIWINSRRHLSRGIYMLDINNTLERPSDDYRMLRSSIINQDGTSYAPDFFYDIKEDHDGNIWIGTNMGPFVITEPDNFRSSSFTFEQVKVSRNDGSGLADYLLNGLDITCIAIDGANRKWFGTINNGIYLLSEDCQEEIAHFTTDNTPLPTNEIFDIIIHPTTGCVYIATGKGLCSYMSDATEGQEELSKDNIVAYPNPVSPDYTGPVVVRGLVADSEVKIVSSNGQIIRSGTSNGGTFTWNACDQRGKRVSSGVYTIIANTEDGKKVATTKITVIR